MGKAGSVPESELDRLLDARIEMQGKIRKVRLEVEREYKAKIDEEIEYRTRNIERAFAVQLVELKEAGATYSELVKVLGQGTASVMRKYVELGGGSVQKRLTGSDRAAARAAEREAFLGSLGVIESFTNDRGFLSFRFESDFWVYVDSGMVWPGYGEDFNASKWHSFKDNKELQKQLIDYAKGVGD